MPESIIVTNPKEIENRSFDMITQILGERSFAPLHEPVIKRVIHATADFDYADILKIGENAVEEGMKALKSGCGIITDTKMAEAGINRKALAALGSSVNCLMHDEAVAAEAAARGVTRAAVSMERAARDANNEIFVIGNAPTALIRLCELVAEGALKPELVIGVPVGFVNVAESKELIKVCGVPYIISEGRKGGSNVAAAIVNALLYMSIKEENRDG